MLDVDGSIGVALYPEHGGDASQLLQRADIAMYAAKRARLGVAVYQPSLDEHSRKRLILLGELRRAIDEGELLLYYQPQADMRTGRVNGVEALVRWQHPQHGLLGAGEFVPPAEQGGLIEPLTRWVMAAALAQCGRWQLEGLRLPVAVNVAAGCLLDPRFPDQVAQMLAERQVPAGLLTVEITESAIMTDPARAREILTRLGELGVRLLLDDFGTGYSSMAYLRALPVHQLKIDRCFVTQMHDEASDQAIVRAVLSLAGNLGLEVVADGVEDRGTWAALADLGCDTGQGELLGRPMPAEELAIWLAERPSPVASHVTR
jgi:EAL domain-containing protein (putative c-di-GMP-specific phosphodiesterase class I)